MPTLTKPTTDPRNRAFAALLIATVLAAGPAPGAACSASAEPPFTLGSGVSQRLAADDDDSADAFLMLTRDGEMKPIRIASLSDQALVYMDPARGWVTLDLGQCIALVSAQAEAMAAAANSQDEPWNRARGLVVLADGQRLPGEPALDSPAQPDMLGWNHPWLGRVDVPLKFIESVLLQPDAVAPPPGEGDVILTVNGDLQHGLVTSIGDPVTIELTSEPGAAPTPTAPIGAPPARQTIDIPLSRIVAIRMIGQRQTGQGRRVWFSEGTVLDVQSIGVSDNGLVRLTGGALAGSLPAAAQVGLGEIAAILFDRQRLLALASLAPSRVEGPATRYTLPRPAVVSPQAPLGLSIVELSGPITVRYALPAGCERFLAEAEMPREARAWGDCELIVRSDDSEVFRTRLHAAAPEASINVPLPAKTGGRELTIEVTEGAHGPIQDLVRLHRPLLVKGK